MPLQIRCTCQQILAVDEAHQGQVVACPYCGTQLTVPVMHQAPQGYAPPPTGYPQHAPPGHPQQTLPQPVHPPQGYQPPGPPPGYPTQNPYPTSGAPAAPNPFGGAPAPAANNPFANLPGAGGNSGNPFVAPPGPTFPAPNVPAFPTPSATAPGPASNAPSMPFLAMDLPGKGGSNLNELTGGTPNVPGDWADPALEDPRLWHIPCPNGHILETPEDMLDQDVLCPYCEKQFTLRKFHSVEETERRERERAIRDEKAGKLWLNWAIGIAAVVILGIIVMIALSASR